MKSMYAKYLTERTKKGILEKEYGFVTYSFMEDGIYIEDIYVEPDYRKYGKASEMGDEIADLAKRFKLKYLYGSVCPEANNSTDSLKVLLAYGFKLQASVQNLIWFKKEI